MESELTWAMKQAIKVLLVEVAVCDAELKYVNLDERGAVRVVARKSRYENAIRIFTEAVESA